MALINRSAILIGSKIFSFFGQMLYVSGFVFRTIKETVLFPFRKENSLKILVFQILFTGVEALNITAILSLSLGGLIIIQGISLLPQFGQGELVYSILITIITREAGPVLTAFIINARSGTAITTELGHMVVSHQIEAYTAIGLDPVRYLVVPRYLGVVFSLILLNVYFNIFGLLGSFLLSQFITTLNFTDYLRAILQHLRLSDLLSSLVKSFFFGSIIALSATYYGLKVRFSSTEIPQMVIKSVGNGFMYCILADAVITMIYYL